MHDWAAAQFAPPADLLAQADAIAAARGLDVDAVRALIVWCTDTPPFAFLGAPRVNLRQLNRALDDLTNR